MFCYETIFIWFILVCQCKSILCWRTATFITNNVNQVHCEFIGWPTAMRLLFFFKQKKLFVFFVIFLFSSNCFRNWLFKLYYFNGWSEIPVAILDLIWQWDKRSLLQISICSKQFREFGSSCIQTVHSNLAQMGGFNFRIGLGLNWKWMWFKFSCIVGPWRAAHAIISPD